MNDHVERNLHTGRNENNDFFACETNTVHATNREPPQLAHKMTFLVNTATRYHVFGDQAAFLPMGAYGLEF